MRDDGPDWSDDADQALRRLGRYEVADGIRAMYLQRIGDTQGAEALLLRSSDPRALDLLVEAAADAGDVDQAIQRSGRALEIAGSPSRREANGVHIALDQLAAIGDRSPALAIHSPSSRLDQAAIVATSSR
jgi:hypothetical protein